MADAQTTQTAASLGTLLLERINNIWKWLLEKM